MSTRETILAALAAQLVAANVAGARVYRARQEQITTLPAVEVFQAGASATEVALGTADHILDITVAVLAKGDTPDTAADVTLAAAHTALMADLSLGLGDAVQLQANWTTEAPELDDFDYIRHTHRYTVTYRTAAGSF